MMGWLTALRDRPIAEQERQRAMIVVVLLLCATALLLTLTGPDEQPRHATYNESQDVVGSAHAGRGAEAATPLTPVVERAVERFLAGYLGYLYGHVPAEKVHGATVSFNHSLRAEALRVPPGMQARTARVVTLRAAPASAGLVGVRVLVNDGGLVDYPVVLLLERRHSRWLVSSVDGVR